MLNIKTLVVGDLATNCYLVSDPNTNEAVIIDPGDEGDFISQNIIDNKLSPIAIILTHGHFDHVLGCLELKLNFNLPIYLHPKDKKLYSSANQSALHWLKKKTLKIPPVDQFIKEGDKIKVGDESLAVIETPGHTPGSICLFDGRQNLFTGDTLFAEGVGRTDFSYSSPLQLTKSLDKIFKFPPQSVIYPGHGDSITLSITLSL